MIFAQIDHFNVIFTIFARYTTMKGFAYIVYLILAVLLTVGCKQESDTFEKQQTSIVNYLESSRRMVAEAEVGSVIEENPPFYTTFGRSAYRHITNYYADDRMQWGEVKVGSVVDISFNAYTFSGSEPQIGSVYWSNIPTTIAAIEKASGNQYADLIWSEEPLSIRVGDGQIIEGIDQALVGCRDQDSVQVYMTYPMAYGKGLVGTVPKHSAVAWYMKILSVSQ